MFKFLRNIVLFLPAILIIAGGTKTVKANDFTAKLVMQNMSGAKIDSFDLCNSEGYIYLIVDLGTVKPTDSLFAFDFFIRYDHTLLSFVPPLLTSNTLAEAIPSDFVYFDVYEDTLRVGGAGISMTPLSGTKPLIACKFQILKNTPVEDSLILDGLDLGTEFRGTVVGVENLKFISKIFDLPERYVSSSLDKDSLVFDSDTVATLISNISFNANINFTNLEFDFDSLKYSNIDSIVFNHSSFNVDSTIDRKYYLTYLSENNPFNGELFRAYFKRNSDSADEETFKYRLTDLSPKSCLKGINLDSALLIYKEIKDTIIDTTGIADFDNNVKLNLSKSILKIENCQLGSKVEIYDVYGRIILSENIETGNAEIDMKSQNAKVFIAYIINNNRIIQKKIFNLFFDQL